MALSSLRVFSLLITKEHNNPLLYQLLNQTFTVNSVYYRGRGLGGDEPPEHLEGGGRAAAARRDARADAARHRRRTLFGAGPSSAWGLSGARPPLSAPGLCRPRGALHRCQSAVRETVIKLRIHDVATVCSSWLPLYLPMCVPSPSAVCPYVLAPFRGCADERGYTRWSAPPPLRCAPRAG